MLDYFPNADHAGIYAAQAGGDFKEAGLDVQIRQPPDPAAPIKQVAAGRVDLAISYEPEVLRARDQGLNVVSVAALVQKPLTSIISLPKAKIRGPADLEGQDHRHGRDRLPGGVPQDDPGRRRRRPGHGQGAQRRLRLQPRAAHREDRRRAGRLLELRGRGPEAARQAPADHPHRGRRRADLQRAGARGERVALERDGDKIRAFIGAISRGTRDLRRDPDRAIEGLLKANPDLDPELQRASVKVTLPLFFPPDGKPFGWQDPAQWDEFSAWMKENQLLETRPTRRRPTTTSCCPAPGYDLESSCCRSAAARSGCRASATPTRRTAPSPPRRSPSRR